MKIFLFSIVFWGSLSLFASPLPGNQIIEEALNESQYVGLALGNHSSIKPLKTLEEFLLKKGKSYPELKYIFVEGPSEIQPSVLAASRNLFPVSQMKNHMDPYWFQATSGNVQTSFFFKELVAAVQQLNLLRAHDPILVVPIDGYNKYYTAIDIQSSQETGTIRYGSSITREEHTAVNFLEVANENPDAKGIVIYHQAHILKNLMAYGNRIDTQGEFIDSRQDFLGWVSFANQYQPGLFDNFSVILIEEEDDAFNPSGILNMSFLSDVYVPNGFGFWMPDIQVVSPLLFKNDGFIMRYRNSTILFPQDINKSFDAVIRY